jgi:cell division protease FtsH
MNAPEHRAPERQPKQPVPKRRRWNYGFLLLVLVAVLLVNIVFEAREHALPYSEFRLLLQEGKIASVEISETEILGELKEPGEDGWQRFRTTRVPEALVAELEAQGVRYTGRVDTSILPTLLLWLLPLALLVVFWGWMLRRKGGRGPGGGFLTIGKSKAKIYMESDTRVTFRDVAGVDEAKEELRETISFLREPEAHGRLGARLPKGVLLLGPPGTGKTLLARAVAGEAGVPFLSISGSEFVEMFVGVGAARVRDLFEQARSKAPCIIFIDELDALGRARNAFGGGMGGHDEKEQTLNQLLVELDGFDPTTGIVLLAATNRPEILDPALLRAGRFDRQILLDRPDKTGRLAILQVHAAKVRLAPEVELDQIAALTPGFTGADLANLVNEAALLATRREGEQVQLKDFTAAIERIVAGLERRTRILIPREREIVAYHEMGHVLVAAALPGVDKVHKVSIIPRGIGALGYTIQRPTEDRYLMTRTELENKMAVLLGGRAAEIDVFDHLSTGAADDLAKATDIARSMVLRYGMADKLGSVVYEREPTAMLGPIQAGLSSRTFSDETAREIDCAVRELVDRAGGQAKTILHRNRAVLDAAAADLLQKETLTAAELEEYFARLDGSESVAPSSKGTGAEPAKRP